MADDAGLREAKRIHQRQHVGRMLIRPMRRARLVAVAEAAQVRCVKCEAGGEARHHRLPGQPEFRPAVQQQKRPALPGPCHVERCAIRPNRQMLHCFCSVFASLGRRNSWCRALSGQPSSPRTRPDRGRCESPAVAPGEVAEWSNAPHSKCGIGASLSGVRIPPSPPFARFCALIYDFARLVS